MFWRINHAIADCTKVSLGLWPMTFVFALVSPRLARHLHQCNSQFFTVLVTDPMLFNLLPFFMLKKATSLTTEIRQNLDNSHC